MALNTLKCNHQGLIQSYRIVSHIGRFWEQLNALPWPDHVALFVSSLIHGLDRRSRIIRRSIVRYLTVAYILTMRTICDPVKNRFPTFEQIHVARESRRIASQTLH